MCKLLGNKIIANIKAPNLFYVSGNLHAPKPANGLCALLHSIHHIQMPYIIVYEKCSLTKLQEKIVFTGSVQR